MSANVDYEAVAATYDRRYEQNVYPGTLGVLEAILRDRPGQRALEVGSATRVHVRARDVSVSLVRPERSSISNVLEVVVLDIHPDRDPAHRLLRLCAAESVLLARVTQRSVVELGLAPGLPVFAQVKSVALIE